MTARDSIRIELTPDQQQQIKDAFGSQITSLALDPRELEQRIAPSIIGDIVGSVAKAVLPSTIS